MGVYESLSNQWSRIEGLTVNCSVVFLVGFVKTLIAFAKE